MPESVTLAVNTYLRQCQHCRRQFITYWKADDRVHCSQQCRKAAAKLVTKKCLRWQVGFGRRWYYCALTPAVVLNLKQRFPRWWVDHGEG